MLLRADDGKYRSVSPLSLARAARALLNFSSRNSRTRSNPRVLWRTVDSTRVQQRGQAPVVSPLPASFHGRDAAFRNFVPCRRRSASRCVYIGNVASAVSISRSVLSLLVFSSLQIVLSGSFLNLDITIYFNIVEYSNFFESRV